MCSEMSSPAQNGTDLGTAPLLKLISLVSVRVQDYLRQRFDTDSTFSEFTNPAQNGADLGTALPTLEVELVAPSVCKRTSSSA